MFRLYTKNRQFILKFTLILNQKTKMFYFPKISTTDISTFQINGKALIHMKTAYKTVAVLE